MAATLPSRRPEVKLATGALGGRPPTEARLSSRRAGGRARTTGHPYAAERRPRSGFATPGRSARACSSPMSTRVRIASLSALRHRSYLALWIGAFVSNVGTWMETIGLGVHVTQLTGKAGWTGTVAALMYMPAMVFGPIGGALADRFDRRRYLAIGSVVQLLIASAMAVLAWHGHLTIPAVSVLSALAGVVTRAARPRVHRAARRPRAPRGSALGVQPLLGAVQPRPGARPDARGGRDRLGRADDRVHPQRGELPRRARLDDRGEGAAARAPRRRASRSGAASGAGSPRSAATRRCAWCWWRSA